MELGNWLNIAGMLVTLFLAFLAAWNITKEKVNKVETKQATDLLNAEKNQNEKRSELAENLWKAINENAQKVAERSAVFSDTIWKAIHENTNKLGDLIGKVDRELAQNRGDVLTLLERVNGRVEKMEAVFQITQETSELRRAALRVHKPSIKQEDVDMDALVNEFVEQLDRVGPMTPERSAELHHKLDAQVASRAPDTGERNLLRLKKQREGDDTPMPEEPSDKAPDQTAHERQVAHDVEETQKKTTSPPPPKEP